MQTNMKTEEEVESWYEEEKKKSIEAFIAVLGKSGNRGKAEQNYTKDLNALFQKYKKLKLQIIAARVEKTSLALTKKTKGGLAELFEKLTAKLDHVRKLIKK